MKQLTLGDFRDGCPGVYRDIPFQDYINLDALSRSRLGAMLLSPAHFATPTSDRPTRATKRGSALHTALFFPEEFEEDFVRFPAEADRRLKVWKDAWADACARKGEEYVLKHEDYNNVLMMADAMRERSSYQELLEGNHAFEVTVVWNDPDTGLLCKARPDIVNLDKQIVGDVKTSKNASFDGFTKAIWEYQYYRQDVWYCQGLEVATDGAFKAKEFRFCVVESTDPFPCGFYTIHEDARRYAEFEIRSLMAKLRQCHDTGEWPGYPDEVHALSLPDWFVRSGLARLERGS